MPCFGRAHNHLGASRSRLMVGDYFPALRTESRSGSKWMNDLEHWAAGTGSIFKPLHLATATIFSCYLHHRTSDISGIYYVSDKALIIQPVLDVGLATDCTKPGIGATKTPILLIQKIPSLVQYYKLHIINVHNLRNRIRISYA